MLRLTALLASICLLAIAGCATEWIVDDARGHLAAGRDAEALDLLADARRKEPQNLEYRKEYFRVRELAVSRWLGQAEALRLARQAEAAAELYRRVDKYDPGNARAAAGLAALETDKRHQALVTQAEALVRSERYLDAQDALRTVLVENPANAEARRLQRVIDEKTVPPALMPVRLRPASAKPMSIDLRDVTLRSVFDVIAGNAGVSFVFDKDVRAEQRTTVSVRNTGLEDLIRLVLTTNQLEQKLVNETTVLVYPNTQQKQREYQELVVKAFYVGNADVKQTAAMLRQLLKAREVFFDEKLGLIAIKDTPSVVRLAERLIAAQDLAEPETMLEVEVLEIATSRLVDLGLRYPESVGVSLVGAAKTPGVVTLTELRNGASGLVQLTFSDPLFLLQLRQQDGMTRVLANPRIRVRNKEKAKIHIGDRVPVITTTAAASGGFVSETVTYLDVGLKLEIESQVHLDDEVGIKVGLEVSNIAREVRGTNSNTLAYQIGTRNAATTLRLKDGETQILAGLITDEDRRSVNRVPGLGELPVLGHLFSQTHDNISKTEIVLLITPRLMRTLARPEARLVEFAAGTEAQAGGGAGVSVGAAPAAAAQPSQPAQAAPVSPAPAPAQTPSMFPPGSPLTPSSPGTMVPFGGVRQSQ